MHLNFMYGDYIKLYNDDPVEFGIVFIQETFTL